MNTNYKVRSASAFLNIEVPVELNTVSATIIHQLMIGINEEGSLVFDRDWIDTENVVYNGVKVKDYRKFMEFHKEIGIDIDRALYDKSEELFSDEECQRIANEMTWLIDYKEA